MKGEQGEEEDEEKEVERDSTLPKDICLIQMAARGRSWGRNAGNERF